MKSTEFFWVCLRRAFRGAWGIADGMSTVVSVFGALVLFYWQPFSETANFLNWLLPITLFVGTIAVGVFWNAYLLYKTEHEQRVDVEQRLAASTADLQHDDDGDGEFHQWDRLLHKGSAIIGWLRASNRDKIREVLADLEKWDSEAEQFVKEQYPEHWPSFSDNIQRHQLKAASHQGYPNIDAIIEFAQSQVEKLGKIAS
jgi:hypothetical protein